jgi:hypothetical protein
MALKRQNSFAGGKLFVLRLKTKDAQGKNVAPYFDVLEKNGDNKYVSTSTTDYVSGKAVKLELKEKEWEGEKYKVANLFLSDNKDLYLLDLRFNMLGRSLFNSLLSLTTYNNLSISVYNRKDKTDDKKEYPAVSLRQNDELVNWKFGLDELPKPVSVTFKGKTMNDYSDVDEFFASRLEELAKLVNGATPTATAAATETVAATEGVKTGNKAEDDVPF